MKNKIVCLFKNYSTWLFFILFIGSYLTSASNANADESQTLFNVGYQILDFKYQKDGEEQTITVAVWYPTTEPGKSYNYGGSTYGNISFNAKPLLDGRLFPLLIFSHGFGGSGLASVFFTEALASNGWIVACPDHHDKYSAARIRRNQIKKFNRIDFLKYVKIIANSGPFDRNKYLYRLDEMQLVLNNMLKSLQFGKFIDKDRIAVGGHSFGGFTALGLCGTIKQRYDSRIKALLLFSTGASGYLYNTTELNTVKIPTLLFMGEKEKNQLRGKETMLALSDKIYKNISPPKYFLEIKGANHFSFNNRFSDKLSAKLMSGKEEHFEVIRRYSIAFLEKYVVKKNNSTNLINENDPLLTHYEMDLALK